MVFGVCEAGTARGSFMRGKELVYSFGEVSSCSVFVISFRASLWVGFGVLVDSLTKAMGPSPSLLVALWMLR